MMAVCIGNLVVLGAVRQNLWRLSDNRLCAQRIITVWAKYQSAACVRQFKTEP
jgi:hypothetical protein